jgi:superfamily II DNA or RNA helicase/SAM-dependent methyltransferase
MTLSHYERSLIVFPSIGLITQFNRDYLLNYNYPNLSLSICSKDEIEETTIEVTTDEGKIFNFIKENHSFLICCTYQSLETLVKVIKKSKCRFNMTIYDEAHRIVGSKVQTLIFEDLKCISQKSLFFTATPKNENGVYMTSEPDHPSTCGDVIFKYTHREAVEDGICRDFEICVNLSMTLGEKNIFECIARNALSTDNYRILVFHGLSNESNSDKTKNRTNVKSFSSGESKKEFKKIFEKIRAQEFPEKKKFKIRFEGITADTTSSERLKILHDFDQAKDDEVFLISSCRTIGEGIDTKRCNHICWADPKQSKVEIIQNIGRGARKRMGDVLDNKKYTISIPISIQKEKYEGCEDQEKRDEVIREEMMKEENWNGILNVLSALRQSEPEFYDLCLNYPNKFCRKEIEKELNIGEKIAQIESENGKEEIVQEEVTNLVDDYCSNKDHPIELFTNSMEEPIKTFGEEKEGEKEILYFDDETNELFQAEIKKEIDEEGAERPVRPPRRKRFNMKVHMDNDLKVLWGIRDGYDLMKEITTVYLDSQVVDNEEKWMENYEKLKEYVEKYNRLPSAYRKDASKTELNLGRWIEYQRRSKRLNRNMNPNKIILLEKIPFWFWNNDLDEEWELNYQRLREYVNTNQKLPSEKDSDEEVKKLAKWCSAQRSSNRGTGRGRELDDIKISKLSNIPFWYWEMDNKWLEKRNLVLNFALTNNRLPNTSKKSPPDEKYLGRWANKQREAYKCIIEQIETRAKLTEERIKLLEEIPFWYWYSKEKNRKTIKKRNDDDIEDHWLEKRNLVFNFTLENNRLPNSSKNSSTKEKELGNWVNSQRRTYKCKIEQIETKAKLTEERIRLLEEIPGWYWYDSNKSESPNKSEKSSSSPGSPVPLPPKPRSYLRPVPNDKEEISTSTQSKFSSSELSTFHQKFKTLHSSTYFSRINSNPEEFKHYHQLSKKAEENDNPEDLPLHIIAGYLQQYPSNYQIADLGCGEATLATLCPQHQFTNFDVYPLNERVQVADITKLPENLTGKFDIVVLSRAMWATNHTEILQEARRILKFKGTLIICEPYRRWNKTEDDNRLETILKSEGFVINWAERNKIENGCYHKFMYYICDKKFQPKSNIKESKQEVTPMDPNPNKESPNIRLTQSVLLSMEEANDQSSSEQMDIGSNISSSTSGRSRKKTPRVKEVSEEEKQKVISSIDWEKLERSGNPKNRKDVYSTLELKNFCEELGIACNSKDTKEKMVVKIKSCK